MPHTPCVTHPSYSCRLRLQTPSVTYRSHLSACHNAGDWFKVEKLVREMGGDDSQLLAAWAKIGQYYSDRHKWSKAAQFYAQAKVGPCACV